MLTLNLFTLKGHYYSLVSPWICGAFLLNTDNYYKWSHRLYPDNVFNTLWKGHYNYLTSNYFTYISIDSSDISYSNNTLIYNFNDRLISYAKSVANQQNKPLTINNINDKVGFYTKFNLSIFDYHWYEVITMRTVYTFRNKYLESYNYNGIDYISLERDIHSHLNLLSTFNCLPPYYIWNKTIKYCKHIYPTPIWYTQEINLNKELLL